MFHCISKRNKIFNQILHSISESLGLLKIYKETFVRNRALYFSVNPQQFRNNLTIDDMVLLSGSSYPNEGSTKNFYLW